MSSTSGIILSSSRLKDLADEVEDLFTHFPTSNIFGQNDALQLKLAQRGFEVWQEHVHITVGASRIDKQFRKWSYADENDVRHVEVLLRNVKAAFDGAKKAASACQARGGAGRESVLAGNGCQRGKVAVLHGAEEELGAFVETVATNIGQLTSYFPSIRASQTNTARIDFQSILDETNDPDDIVTSKLSTASTQADPALQCAISHDRPAIPSTNPSRQPEHPPASKPTGGRHLYEENESDATSRVMNGDYRHVTGAGIEIPAQGHTYRENRATGASRVLNGDYVGDGSGMETFWDN